MSSWWKANRWFVIALAVLIPGAVVVSMIPRWFPYVERQPVPETVTRGDTVHYSGADIQLTELRVLDGLEWDAPAGADVVVATVSIDVTEPVESYCQLELVSTEHGFERKWDSELFSDSDFEVGDEYATSCTFAEPGRYRLQTTFLVPAGQVQDPVLQLTSQAALPRVLRLS